MYVWFPCSKAVWEMLTDFQTFFNGCLYGLSISGSVELVCGFCLSPFVGDCWTMSVCLFESVYSHTERVATSHFTEFQCL